MRRSTKRDYGGLSLEFHKEEAIHPRENHGIFWQNPIEIELLNYFPGNVYYFWRPNNINEMEWFGITEKLERDALRRR